VGLSLDSLLAEITPSRPLLVHRLDKDTSGLILTAKNREAAAHFSALFAGRTVQKQYLAVSAGVPRPPEGSIRFSLKVRGREKEAETRYRLLGPGSFELARSGEKLAVSLLELELCTGRTHQIRRHLARIGCPVLGDDKYGDFALNKKLRKEPGLKQRLFLHAWRLRIPDIPGLLPRGLDISAPPPEHFETLEIFRSWFHCAEKTKDLD
jgi:23S rRNA pseudouridine955/2504/2580 synthase